MSCLVKLYEKVGRAHVGLRASSLSMVAVDKATLINCSPAQNNGPLWGHRNSYGADLQFPKGPIVYQDAIADTQLVYAGTTVPNLNGDIDGDLDAHRRDRLTLDRRATACPPTSRAPLTNH